MHDTSPNRAKKFEIYSDRTGRWCARRLDGLVFGVFIDLASALRFVRLEGNADFTMAAPA